MLTDEICTQYCNALPNLQYHTVLFIYIPEKNSTQQLKFT